ncbi:MAG: recombinase family protein, partial [Eubacteriales bacterium]|nr:recombinase family protein [Eubacteriales bacterium]
MRKKENLVAIYCRLSKEDLEKTELHCESESIKNQKAMLETYAQEKGWAVYDCYIDEDYSGSDRNRPEFNRLITDSIMNRFGIVLCKKQSRFAR